MDNERDALSRQGKQRVNLITAGHVGAESAVLSALRMLAYDSTLLYRLDRPPRARRLFRPPVKKEFTENDQRRIDAAEVKRQRKNAKRLALRR